MNAEEYLRKVRVCINDAETIVNAIMGEPSLLENLGFRPNAWAKRYYTYIAILQNLLKDVTLTE